MVITQNIHRAELKGITFLVSYNTNVEFDDILISPIVRSSSETNERNIF